MVGAEAVMRGLIGGMGLLMGVGCVCPTSEEFAGRWGWGGSEGAWHGMRAGLDGPAGWGVGDNVSEVTQTRPKGDKGRRAEPVGRLRAPPEDARSQVDDGAAVAADDVEDAAEDVGVEG